jgi:hypothetical protein
VDADEPPDSRRAVESLREENPQWLILFGSWTRELVAFPLFPAPVGAWVAAKDVYALTRQMRQAEQRYGYQSL